MSIPYRARRALRSFFVTVLVLILVAALLLTLWLLWLNRYVVYTRDGAKLDFDIKLQFSQGQTPVEPEPAATVEVHTKSEDEEDAEPDEKHGLAQLNGCYVTLEELKADFDAVSAQLLELPTGSTIMLELKDVKGIAYYTSSIATAPSDFDTALVDSLVSRLQERECYVIAQIPAFQEYYYILADERERVPYGLPKAGGSGSLWLDSSGPCYWLDPASDGTITYLIQLISELRSLGYDEVVLSGYRFPNTDSIAYTGDKLTALTDTAATLVKTCSTDSFCVSFTRTSADLALPAGHTRLYLTGVNPSDLEILAAQSGLEDPAAQMVLLTDSGDTRYDEYSVLRPLASLHE